MASSLGFGRGGTRSVFKKAEGGLEGMKGKGEGECVEKQRTDEGRRKEEGEKGACIKVE